MSARLVAAAVLAVSPLLAVASSTPVAAGPCPDVEVVFARGTGEPPGVGGVGQAFIDAFKPQVGGRSIGVYGVNYPASNDFSTSTPAGANDARAHVQSMAANCPGTRMVLGGYSQGAAVIDLITSPANDSAFEMPPDVADHVAAVAVFGNPSIGLGQGPLTATSPLYGSKTIDVCVPLDPVCTPGSPLMLAHVLYVPIGVVGQAASFAASRL